MAKKKAKKKKTSTFGKASRRLLLKAALWAFSALALFVLYCMATLPKISEAIYRDRTPAATILSAAGNEVYSFGTVYDAVVRLEELPAYMPDAVVAIEDRRFYSHFGFDIVGFTRAMTRNIWHRRFAEGGSTITQQAAKNLFLSRKKNIARKVQELLLAFWLERKFSKEQILALYLNRVYLGTGVYGIDAAARRYFGKPARLLNPLEAAVIAGMLKAPSAYNPISDKAKALARANVVLGAMVREGKMTREEEEAAKRMPLGDGGEYLVGRGRYFADAAYGEAVEIVGEREEDIVVSTTLDERIQRAAEEILKEAIEANRDKKVGQGAVVVMDYSGRIRAMAGGVDYSKSQFNRATQALRQPGSTFKPFVYAAALAQGWRPTDTIEDTPLAIGKWKPSNFDKKSYGKVTLSFALAKSLNLAAVDLASKVGFSSVAEAARAMGISSKLEVSPSLALGTSLVRVVEMAGAYAAIANGGIAVSPYAVEKVRVKGGSGEILYERGSVEGSRVFSQPEMADMRAMLRGAVEGGTGRAAQIAGVAVMGKTGTTQNSRDAWFIGFADFPGGSSGGREGSGGLVGAVWLGNDDNSPMAGVTGGGLPAEIWRKIMSAALK